MKVREWLLRGPVRNAEGGESAPAAPAPAPAENSRGISTEVMDIMNFDPFADTAPQDGGGDPVAQPEAAPTPVEQPTPEPPAPPAPDLTQTVQELRQTVQELPHVMREAAAPKPAAPAEPDPYLPMDGGTHLNYAQIMSQVPDQVLTGLRSENPAEQKLAVANLLGVAMHVTHRLAAKQAVEMVQAQMSRVLPEFVNEQLRARDTAQAVHNDFYGKFPQLSHPALKQLVMTEAGKLAQQLGVRQWDANFRDRLGEHVMRMLPPMGQPAAPVAQPATPMMGPSARPMGGMGPTNQQQEIADLLGM